VSDHGTHSYYYSILPPFHFAPTSMASLALLRRTTLSHSHVRARAFSEGKSSNRHRIEKILVANRGEIACRITRTARRLGIQTVAVYSDADKDSLHVASADKAIRIGPPPARLSYLNGASIVDAAIRSGAQVNSSSLHSLSLCFSFFVFRLSLIN